MTKWGHRIGGNSWRIGNDIEDNFDSIIKIVKISEKLLDPDNYGPGIGWNDPDMLQVGNGGMSYD